MGNRKDDAPTAFEDSRYFNHGSLILADVLESHEADNNVEGTIREAERSAASETKYLIPILSFASSSRANSMNFSEASTPMTSPPWRAIIRERYPSPQAKG